MFVRLNREVEWLLAAKSRAVTSVQHLVEYVKERAPAVDDRAAGQEVRRFALKALVRKEAQFNRLQAGMETGGCQ